VWLTSIVAVLIACPIVTVVDAGRLIGTGIVALVFAIALIWVGYLAWRAVAVHQMSKMEAWWWLSTPYSVAYLLCSALLGWEHVGWHVLGLFILVFLATASASLVWTLVTLYQVFHRRQLTAWRGVMLGLALLLLVTLWVTQIGATS